jgi:hypothetical protein
VTVLVHPPREQSFDGVVRSHRSRLWVLEVRVAQRPDGGARRVGIGAAITLSSKLVLCRFRPGLGGRLMAEGLRDRPKTLDPEARRTLVVIQTAVLERWHVYP